MSLRGILGRSAIRGLASEVYRALLWKQFGGREIFVPMDEDTAHDRPVYCRGVTYELTPEGAIFTLKCFAAPAPMLTGKNKIRVWNLDVRYVHRIGKRHVYRPEE